MEYLRELFPGLSRRRAFCGKLHFLVLLLPSFIESRKFFNFISSHDFLFPNVKKNIVYEIKIRGKILFQK
jgi:hypothetical protein